MKRRFTDEQIIGFLKETGAGTPVKELCRSYWPRPTWISKP